MYNDSFYFNWTRDPEKCYVEDFIFSVEHRPYFKDVYPIKGCSADIRNNITQQWPSPYRLQFFTNVSFEPRLDYFFNHDKYPPADKDPPTSMTFKFVNTAELFIRSFQKYNYHIVFGRCDDYHPIPKISKRTGKPIPFIGNKALLSAKYKIVKTQFVNTDVYDYSYSDNEILDYEGEEFNTTFDGYTLNLSILSKLNRTHLPRDNDFYSILVKVYDLPRMKVQGLFQYTLDFRTIEEYISKNNVTLTVDTRNIFFQNISMFYNQKVNVTDEGLEPTGEDSGFWVNTPCNRIQMATIMVDYHFFDIIHRMQSYGYEFGDRFQLRIHTPYYRKTPNSAYSLFRSQWNDTYPEPRVFIHPISKYKEYCETYKNCTKFNYDEWSTDPKFTKYIIDVKNEIRLNQIWINFTELEKIYEADGFHRSKLVINVNNTMTPHITQITNGLWAELYDTVTQDWVMKTKTSMDEVHGYIDEYEPDPYRNFYLTCEIPDNITADDVEFYVKKYGVLQTAHLWLKLDVFSKGITKLYPPRFNTIFKFPPEILVTNSTFMYTYQYYIIPGDIRTHYYWILKDLRKTGIEDGTITNDTFDIGRNQINVSELHHNYPNGDDTYHYNMSYPYRCNYYYTENSTCIFIEMKRQFLYYFYDLSVMYDTNDTGPIDISVYHIKYVPYHSKSQINRGLHRWNQHHAGWIVPNEAKYIGVYRYYSESNYDNFYFFDKNSGNYYNLRGSTNIPAYSGPNCIFSFSGGSTMRNTSCEFWNGIIPDKPFTNYARDIYEEHIAYRTLNDHTFSLNTSKLVKAFRNDFELTCSLPNHMTCLVLRVAYWNFQPDRFIEDGEPICAEFLIPPVICDGYTTSAFRNFKPVFNIHEYPREYFTRLDLPKELSLVPETFGRVSLCNWPEREMNFILFKSDYYCYYVNSSVLYAFHSLNNFGELTITIRDIVLRINGVFFTGNYSVPKLSGHLTWGFYDDPFMYTDFPEDTYHTYNNQTNATIFISRDNETNDAISTYIFNLTFRDIYYYTNVFKFDFENIINYIQIFQVIIDNVTQDFQQYSLIRRFYQFTVKPRDYWEPEELCCYLNVPDNINYSFVILPTYNDYYYYYYKNARILSHITKNQTMNFLLKLKVVNPRMIKPFDLFYTLIDDFYACTYQVEHFILTNTKPQNLLNMTVTPNSYFTSDRAVYRFNYETYMRSTLIGDVFEFKTSWKTKYNKNEEVPDENGYYINRIYINRNYSHFNGTNMTLYAMPILNPSTLETQYIKDIRMIDKDGYLLSVCGDVFPIKMKKLTGFKYYEIYTNKTNEDTRFDISLEVVPEILINKSDILRMKFSSAVSLKEYPECKLESDLGLNILDPDFKCEIDVVNNELILSNVFKDIGENLTIFENLTSIPITDQKFNIKLKDVPIYCKNNDHERIYSVELMTENYEGIITQKTPLPSIALFKCDYRCKTCQEGEPSICITCNENYPFFFPEEQNCRKFCPKEKLYEQKMENGEIWCLPCESPCENCIGTATNCTLCNEGYFMQNNKTCSENCDEGYEKDYVLRRCYPIIEKNETIYVERTVFVNVSVPDYYPVYIERNVCMID